MDARHKSVLLEESILGLNIREGSVVVDATLGGGGHSNRILQEIGPTGTLIVIDQDNEAVENFKIKIKKKIENVHFITDNFCELESILQALKIEKVDAILADLGYSSIQLEDNHIGMSFLADAPLDMRLNRGNGLSARDIVNDYSVDELDNVLKEYGEEKFSKLIARKIVDKRRIRPIETTMELVEIIKTAIPLKFQYGKLHPATKTFQALRIETNRELEVLEIFIAKAIDSLREKGRLVVISFHSLEDRIVKKAFREKAMSCVCPVNFPICQCDKVARIKIITKKPIVPSEMEIQENPKARSAKLRICEKL
jgi:16S rRNA (cytosine1402-N4)-methyltransferase